MKRFLMTGALTCVLSVTGLAGGIPSGDDVPPPPGQPTHMTSAPAPGDVPTGDYTHPTATDITLTAVQALISLLSV